MLGAKGKPVQWEAAWDSNTKKWFYQDRNNGEATWNKPAGVTFDLPREPPKEDGSSRPVPETCPPGWEPAWDSGAKKYYYFNRKTEERVWTFKLKPKAGAAEGSAAASLAAPQHQGREARTPSPRPFAAGPGRPGAAATGSSSASGRTSPARGANPNPSPGRRESPVRGAHGAAPRGRRQDGTWDHEEFLHRLREAKATGDQRNVKRVLVDVSESNYQLRDQWRFPKTSMVSPEDVMRHSPAAGDREPQISFSSVTTADAIKFFAKQGRQVCALNFANGSSVGGGYKNGAIAQEEDLCRRCPTLYTSLNNAKRDRLYPFGPPTCQSLQRPERYSYVLFTPDVVLARGGEETGFKLWPREEQVQCSLITAAAPNINPNARVKEVYDLNLMYETVKSIFKAPKILSKQTNTLVLGAWGCGVFSCNPHEMSSLFVDAIKRDRLGTLYDEIHFAIPSFSPADQNGKIFLETLKKNRIDVRELEM